MNGRPPPNRPEDAPGHYGPGYGEQVPENAPPRPAPATDDEDPDAPEPPADASAAGAGARIGDDGEPVVFTPADIGMRPPDQPPTASAPESEKASLIFERS